MASAVAAGINGVAGVKARKEKIYPLAGHKFHYYLFGSGEAIILLSVVIFWMA
ncbi:MAG: hypothetical protein KAI88_02030 [Nitrosomonadaceae bacterium]|nr:hypothetical protein [Nitrosomonadaceae bacterium]